QAEDGIRDRNVTGVQTCALPISSTRFFRTPHFWVALGVQRLSRSSQTLREMLMSRGQPRMDSPQRLELFSQTLVAMEANSMSTRSEERRVGKEFSAMWSQYHEI